MRRIAVPRPVRTRWIAAIALGASLLAGAQGIAAAQSTAPEPPGAVNLGDPRVAHGYADAKSRSDAWRKRRDEPRARAERLRSRRAHADLGPGAARRLAKQEFPAAAAPADGAPLRLPSGLEFGAVVAPDAVRVKTATGGKAGVAFSTGPLTGRSGEVMNLSLVKTAGGFASRDPLEGAKVLIGAAEGGPDWEPNLMSVAQRRTAGEILTGVDTRRTGREIVDIEERYDHDDEGRVASIHVRQHRAGGVGEEAFEAVYDERGALARLISTVRAPGEPERRSVSYARRDPGAVRDARRLVRDSLPGHVAAWVERAAPQEPVVALALLYSREIPGLPPALAIATERDRAQLAAREREPGIPPDVWNTAEWSVLEADVREFGEDVDLQAAYRLLLEHFRDTRAPDGVRDILVGCAQALAERSWTELD